MQTRVSNLLFYSAAFALIILLIVAGYTVQLRESSEYWDLAQTVAPSEAAMIAFEDGDYRMLGIRVQDAAGDTESFVGGVFSCSNHPSGNNRAADFAKYVEIGGLDAWSTVESIRDYARDYNYAMADLLSEHLGVSCGYYDVGQ